MNTKFLACLGLAVSLAAFETSAQIVTGPVVNQANGHSYYLLGPVFWTDAEAQGIALGGHLVTINDAAENLWVYNSFSSFGGQPRALEIGLTDQGHEGIWTWVSGEPVTFLNWAPGEPNNGMGIYPYENVALMWSPADPWPAGSWNDMMGTLPDQKIWAVVEVVPEPSAAMLLGLAVGVTFLRTRSAFRRQRVGTL